MSEWPVPLSQCIRGAGRAAVCAPAARGRGRESGEQRNGEGTGQRDSIADGTALRCGRVGSRHFRRHRGFIPEGSFRGHYPKYTSSNAVWLKVLGCAPLSPRIENYWGPRTNEICVVSLGAGGILSTTCDDYLLACPSFLSLVPLRSTKIFGGEKSLFFLLFLFSPFRL